MKTDHHPRRIRNDCAATTEPRSFFASAALGLETLLASELKELGAFKIRIGKGGVFFTATLETAYRACLWTRLASRILMPLASFSALTPEELYAGTRAIDWNSHLDKEGTFAVDCHIFRSRIKHSHFAALKAKDAIVDQFRDNFGIRPSVNLENPDIRVNLYIERNRLTVSLDLSGDSLHRRGYREKGGPAPLKENLAAAILILSDWPKLAGQGEILVDPMCGSGTLLIEGALLAMDMAPGLVRDYYGFRGWKGHQPQLWEKLLAEAARRKAAGMKHRPRIFGFDVSPEAMDGARLNASRAGVESCIELRCSGLQELNAPMRGSGNIGLIVANPPYGQRLGHQGNLVQLYSLLGRQMRQYFRGWKAGILTAAPELEKKLGLSAEAECKLFNGPIECRLYHYRIGREPVQEKTDVTPWQTTTEIKRSEMLANRLRKNLRTLRRWKEQEGVTCYRLYDADIPEYAAAIDIYENHAHIQEYAAPSSVDPDRAELRLNEILVTLAETLDLPAEHIFLKIRKKQKGRNQYSRQGSEKKIYEVREGGLLFQVNFSDYLDTGLFLDHRPTRRIIGETAAGKHFLNLFAYTGTASVYAAAGGALTTLSVDSSRNYLEWAKRNFLLNGLQLEKHAFIQADCLEWLEKENRRFDLVFLDPPTFSNSNDRKTVFDIQKDYPDLLKKTVRLLSDDGELLFSCNFRKFKLEPGLFPELAIEDISPRTIPPDFKRNTRIHHCWKIRHKKS